MISQIKQPQDHHVTGAKKTARGVYVHIAGYWPRVDGNERYFDEGAVILLDTSESECFFDENYLARYHGNPADSAAPNDLRGGTTDPVVLHIVEHWLMNDALLGADKEVSLPVPTAAQANAELPRLRAVRRACQKQDCSRRSTLTRPAEVYPTQNLQRSVRRQKGEVLRSFTGVTSIVKMYQ